MSKRNQMIISELNQITGNVITRVDDCCHGYKISKATKITLVSVCREGSTGQI